MREQTQKWAVVERATWMVVLTDAAVSAWPSFALLLPSLAKVVGVAVPLWMVIVTLAVFAVTFGSVMKIKAKNQATPATPDGVVTDCAEPSARLRMSGHSVFETSETGHTDISRGNGPLLEMQDNARVRNEGTFLG